MNRLFLRETGEEYQSGKPGGYRDLNQLNIGVTGLGQDVGTTFVATSLAFCLQSMGKNPTFLQCVVPSRCSSLLYDRVAMDRRFASRTFSSIYEAIRKDSGIRNINNIERGINWLIPSPSDCHGEHDLDDREIGRMLNAARDSLNIFDIEASERWDDLLKDMDVIVAVVDPLPSKLIRMHSRFVMLKKLELSGVKIIWTVNKMNGGVSRREIVRYLKTKKIYWIDYIETGLFYNDEYCCRFHWENKEIRSHIMEIFTEVSQEIVDNKGIGV